MPPIEVPKLKQVAPTPTPSVGRLDYKAPDFSQAEAIQSKAAVSAADKIETFAAEQQRLSAENLGLKGANEYHQEIENQLNQIKNKVDADPAELYKNLADYKDKKREEIMTRNPDLPEYSRQALKSSLEDVDVKFYDRINTSQAAQTAQYVKKTTNGGVGIAQADMLDATAHLNVADPDTTIPLQMQIDKIYDLRIKEGLQNGGATPKTDENGKVIGYQLNPSLNLQIKKDTEKGLKEAIENLSVAGDVEGAKFLQEKYGQYLTGDVAAKLTEKNKKNEIDNKANALFNQARSMGPEAAQALINKEKDPEVAKKALANIATYKAEGERLTKMSQDKNYDYMLKQVIQKQRSDNPFVDDNALMNDPTFKRTFDRMSGKQQESLLKIVKPPEESNSTIKNSFYEDMAAGKLEGMSYTDFAQRYAGLSKNDLTHAAKLWEDLNVQTPKEKTQMTKYMSGQLDEKLQMYGYVKKNQYGKYSVDDENKINSAREKLQEAIARMPPGLTPDKQDKYLSEFAASVKKQEAFSPSSGVQQKKFQSSPIKPNTATEIKKTQQNVNSLSEIGTDQKFKAASAFYQATKAQGKPRTPDLKSAEGIAEFQKFISNGNKF